MGEFASLVSRLRFSHLRLLLTLKEQGSLRKAAECLHQTQSALSKSLKEIECAVGCTLYERLPGKLRPTAEGESMTRAAQLLLAELGQMHASLDAISQGRRLTLRLGATPFLALTLVPMAISAFDREFGGHRFDLVERPVPQLLEMLCEGALDAILATWTPREDPEQIEALSLDVLRPESFVVIASPESPLAARTRVRLRELLDQPWILPSRPSLVRTIVDQACIAQGLRPPVPFIESMSPSTNVGLVAKGLGVAALPGTAMLAAERAGIVKRLMLDSVIPCPPVALVYRRAMADTTEIEQIRKAFLEAGRAEALHA